MATEAAKPKKRTAKAKAPGPRLIGYKGFDKNLQCRGFQFEVGQTYRHEGKVVACLSGFHVITADNPLRAFAFYPPRQGARYAEVRYAGQTASDTSRPGCNKLAVSAMVGQDGIEPDTLYTVRDGKLVAA